MLPEQLAQRRREQANKERAEKARKIPRRKDINLAGIAKAREALAKRQGK